MSTSGAIKAGRAFVELFADDSKLVSGLKKAKAKLSAFGAGVRESGMKLVGVGAALIAPMLGAAKAFAESGSALALMSERTGISVESLSQLSYAAQMSGLSVEDFEKALFKMQKMMGEAATSGKSTCDELSNLGLTFADIKGLNPEQQFKAVADRISKIKNPTERAAAAMSIFGRSGAMLLPMMEKGAAGIDELMQAADALGLTMSSTDAQAAHDLERAMQTVWVVLKKVYATIGAALAPVLMKVAGYILDVAQRARAWIEANQELIVTVFKVAAGIIAAGAALVAIGTLFIYAAKGIGVLISVVGIIHSVLSGLVAVLGFVLSPVGLVITAFVALAAFILKASGAIDAVLQWIGEGFTSLANECKAAFGAIGKALAKGDLAAAAKVLWLLLKAEWIAGIDGLDNLWSSFWTGLKITFSQAWHGLLLLVNDGVLAISKAINWGASLWDKALAHTTGFFEDLGTTAKMIGREIEIALDTSLTPEQRDKKVQESRLKAAPEFENTETARAAALREADLMKAKMDKGAEQVHKDAEANILKEGLAQQAAIKAAHDLKVAANEEEVKKAKADLAAAMAEANAPEPPGKQRKGLDWLKKGMEGMGDELAFGKGKNVTAAGTFNANALQGLVGGTAPERTAKATEATQKNTKLLVDLVRNKPDSAFA